MYVDPIFVPPEQTRKVGKTPTDLKEDHKKWEDFILVVEKPVKGKKRQSKR